MFVITVANQKGGVGKTTTTVSVGGILSSMGRPTLLIDMDPQCSLTAYFGYKPDDIKLSMYDLFLSDKSHHEVDIFKAIRGTKFPDLFLLPASPSMATLDRYIAGKPGMGLVLRRALWKLRDRFDYAVIDCPPVVGVSTINALASCHKLIMPVQTEFLAIKGMERMRQTLPMIEKSLSKEIDYIVVPTMYDKRTSASVKSLDVLRSQNGGRVWGSLIPVDTQLREASEAGVPINIYNGRSRASCAYEQLVSDVIGLAPQSSAQTEVKHAS